METTVIREQKYVLVSGIVYALLFSSISLIFCIIKIEILAIIFLPFILWGIYLILRYYRYFIKLKTNKMIVSEPFKRNRIIRYAEINTVSIQASYINHAEHVEVILLNYQKKRLLKFARDMINADILIGILETREIPFDYLPEIRSYSPGLTTTARPKKKAGQDIGKYFPALTKRGIKKITKEKLLVKKLDWIMIGIVILAIILGGKLRYALFAFVLLLTWGMYVWMYPNLFLGVPEIPKIRKYVIEIPILGPGVAGVFCIFYCISYLYAFNFYYYDFLHFLEILTIILLSPFAIKLCMIKGKPDIVRIKSGVFSAFILAFIIVIPINYSTTFQDNEHESIIVNDKDTFSYKNESYYIYADWQEENQKFSVSKSQYNEYQKGDHLQVCLRRSIFGFQYWTVHK